MSFILDALRKSEHERQRGAVPGISHVPLAVPRREVPGWVFGVIGVLTLGVVGLGGAWWLNSRESPEAPAAAAAVPRVPLDVPARAPAPPLRAPEPAARPPARAATPAPEPATAATPALPESTLPPPTPRVDEAPMTARVAPPARPEPVSTEPPLPSASALAADGIAVPPLRLELHGFSDSPAQRFVFINGTRYREGETLREGPRLLSIERNGAVLSHQGRRFMLAPQ